MEIKEILYQLRRQKGWSQDQLAEKLYVTRQAVSRWETGETTPNTEALKLLSRLFDVSINTLLGCPRKLVCQCCGMPLEDDAFLSKEPDGSFNEDYCKWCYADGAFTYASMDALIDYLTQQFSSDAALDCGTSPRLLSVPVAQAAPLAAVQKGLNPQAAQKCRLKVSAS